MLQIISDIHLEVNDQLPSLQKHPDAQSLALLGDIGHPFTQKYKNFIAECALKFDHVLIIAGNHEYYSSEHTLYEIQVEIGRICAALGNCTFLSNSLILLEGVRILGTTLWSHIPVQKQARACSANSDYLYIRATPEHGRLTPSATNKWHSDAVKFVETALADRCNTQPLVVLSHFAPLDIDDVHPAKYHGSSMRCCYATDLSALFRSPLIAWAYGHTHHPLDITYNGVHVLSNPHGYSYEIESCNGLEKLVCVNLKHVHYISPTRCSSGST
jgi:predicted phosphodiesterase